MTLQQLIYFREVANTLHFKRASDNLFVAQSSLSHAIQILEREIGAPLFVRKNGKKIFLTEYGKAFLPYVENMLSQLDEGKAALERMVMRKKGTVSIAYSFINGCAEISKLFQAFYADGENRDIQLHSLVNHGGTAFIADHLTGGMADLALSCCRFGDDPAICARKIYKQQLYVVLPSAHALAKSESLTLEQIKDEYLIMMSGSMSLYDHIQDLYTGAGIVPKMIDGLSDWTAQMDLVACGRGISILPQIPFYTDSISFVPLEHPDNKRDVYLLWPSDRRLSPVAEQFKDFCIGYFQ